MWQRYMHINNMHTNFSFQDIAYLVLYLFKWQQSSSYMPPTTTTTTTYTQPPVKYVSDMKYVLMS